MERVTLKTYAVKHKLSMFSVMKMVKSGKLMSEVVQEKGREVIYILYGEQSEKEIEEQIIPVESSTDIRMYDELMFLKKEVNLLKKEIEDLKKRIS